MQKDMHFYGTYAIARLAGFERGDAHVIATSAEFVDDSSYDNTKKNKNAEIIFPTCTAHHPADAGKVSWSHPEVHRLVWVPFHFYPGGKGDSLHEKLLCLKDSKIVNQMFDNHIGMGKKAFYLYLLGIASHVYMDTFSHYGFSGICSELNEVNQDSIKTDIQDPKIRRYVEEKRESFWEKFGEDIVETVKTHIGEEGSRGLGHGAVATYPDRPFLKWQFDYEEGRHGKGTGSGLRDNPETFEEGLVKLHEKLSQAAREKYDSPNRRDLPLNRIREILAFEGTKEERMEKWTSFISEFIGDEGVDYGGEDWEEKKDIFPKTSVRDADRIGHYYRFHQAAVYHRWYTLKDLLPEHDIYVV